MEICHVLLVVLKFSLGKFLFQLSDYHVLFILSSCPTQCVCLCVCTCVCVPRISTYITVLHPYDWELLEGGWKNLRGENGNSQLTTGLWITEVVASFFRDGSSQMMTKASIGEIWKCKRYFRECQGCQSQYIFIDI